MGINGGFKFCQSCGRPMKRIRDYGKKADGKRSKVYCSECFIAGEFKEPELELEAMINKVALDLAREMGIDEGTARLMAEKMVPNLKRWREE